MRLTNFGSVVSKYKENFLLRKKKFFDDRKKIKDQRRKDREDKIEAVKAIEPLIKINFGKGYKPKNFLGGIQRFLGFALAGLIVSNLKNIIPVIAEIFKKTKEILKGIKNFVTGIGNGIKTVFDGLESAKQTLDNLILPILSADLSKFVPFQNELERVLSGVLSIAGIITGLYSGAQAGGGGDKPTDTLAGSTAAAAQNAVQRKAARIKALQEAKELKAQKQAQRVAAREAVNTLKIEKAFSKAVGVASPSQTLISTGASTAINPGGSREVLPTSKNLIDMTKDAFKNKSLINLQKILDDPKSPDLYKLAAQELINENMEKARLIDNFTPDELKARAIQDQGKAVPRKEIIRLGDEAKKRSLASQQKPLSQSQAMQNIFNKNTPILLKKKSFNPNVPIASPKPSDVTKFKQVMKNAKGFIKPSNFAKLGKFAKDFGAGLALEFAAGWLIDRGLEQIGFDEKSLLEKRVMRFIKLPKEEQKQLVENLNQQLEKELDYQKGFFAKVDKVLALGDMTQNEKNIKTITSLLTAISISGAGAVYDLDSSNMPDYLGGNIDLTLPFSQPTTSLISGLPPLPPTGTGSSRLAAAQQYGAARPGGRIHAGQDFDPIDDKNSKFYSRIGGEVIFAGNVGGGYGNVVDIYNKELGYTERIAEGNRIHVKVGDVVKPGTLVQSGSEMTGVFHYEIRKGKATKSGSFDGTVNPLEFLKNLKPPKEVSMKSSPSNITSSTGLDQPTSYSEGGVAVRREVNNIIIPINA